MQALRPVRPSLRAGPAHRVDAAQRGRWRGRTPPADHADGPAQQCDDRRNLPGLLFTDSGERVHSEEVARRRGLPVGSVGPSRARRLAKLHGLIGQV